MSTLKAWMGERLDTPEKARTAVSNIALGGGIFGAIMTILALLTAHF